MPNLDFANPLHTFSTGNLSWTATKDCYVCGQMMYDGTTTQHNTLSIDSVVIAVAEHAGNSVQWTPYIPPIKVKAGSVIAVSDYGCPKLHAFDVIS